MRTIGARGSGPGEYRSPVAMDIGPDGHVYVFDVAGMRLVVFDSAGKELKTTALPGNPHLYFGGIQLVGGAVYGLSTTPAKSIRDTVDGAINRLRTGEEPHELAKIRMPALVFGEHAATATALFRGRPRFRVAHDGSIIFTSSDEYAVTMFDSTGKIRDRFQVDVPRIPVGKADIDTGLAHLSAGAPSNATEFLRTAAKEAPKYFPAISDLFVQPDGSFWIKRGASVNTDSARWDFFSSHGSANAYMWLSARDRLLGERAGQLLVVRLDSLDVETATWYKVRKASK